MAFTSRIQHREALKKSPGPREHRRSYFKVAVLLSVWQQNWRVAAGYCRRFRSRCRDWNVAGLRTKWVLSNS